jgi:hypothetical protein
MSKKFIISEKEKSRISNIHNKRILMEREGDKLSEQTTQQPTQTAPQQPTQTAPQQPSAPTTPRYSTAVCPAGKVKCDQTVLRIQVRMNDECAELSPKLVEDGIYGKNTTAAWALCKSKLKPTKQVQGGGSQSTQTTGTTPEVKVGEPISANDIATLIGK